MVIRRVDYFKAFALIGPSELHYKVYPRVCGGTEVERVAELGQQGLSPRVRGNHLTGGIVRTTMGSIPACAGEPEMEMSASD